MTLGLIVAGIVVVVLIFVAWLMESPGTHRSVDTNSVH